MNGRKAKALRKFREDHVAEFSDQDKDAVIGQLFMQKTAAEQKMETMLNFLREAAQTGRPVVATLGGFEVAPEAVPDEAPTEAVPASLDEYRAIRDAPKEE